jgi:hypothetical protein
MAEFTRSVRQNAAEVLLKDGIGKVVRKVKFNPHDIRGRKVFAEIVTRADTIDEKTEAAATEAGKLIVMVDELDIIFAGIDKVFGAGTTDFITEGFIDEVAVENLHKFFTVVRPYFDKAEQTQKDRVMPFMVKNGGNFADSRMNNGGAFTDNPAVN